MGTILSYVFYWIAVIVTLIVMKFTEVCATIKNPLASSEHFVRVVLHSSVKNQPPELAAVNVGNRTFLLFQRSKVQKTALRNRLLRPYRSEMKWLRYAHKITAV